MNEDSDSSDGEENTIKDNSLARKLSKKTSTASNKSTSSSNLSDVSQKSIESAKSFSEIEGDRRISTSQAAKIVTNGSGKHSSASSVISSKSDASSEYSNTSEKLKMSLNGSSHDVSRLDVDTENVVESSYVTVYKNMHSPTHLENTLETQSFSETSVDNNEHENNSIKVQEENIQNGANESKSTSVSSFVSEASSKSSRVFETSKDLANNGSPGLLSDSSESDQNTDSLDATATGTVRDNTDRELQTEKKSASNQSIGKRVEPNSQTEPKENEG